MTLLFRRKNEIKYEISNFEIFQYEIDHTNHKIDCPKIYVRMYLGKSTLM